VPGVQALLPPTNVEYENVPLLASANSCASSTSFEPCCSTKTKTLSGPVGVGVIVPFIV
jgi:hypothetical protein